MKYTGGYDQWTPHIPVVVSLTSKTFISEFRGDKKVIWLIVNRDKHNDEIVELRLNGLSSGLGQQWFDLYHGIKLDDISYNNFSEPFHLHVEANGYGAILVTLANDEPGRYIQQLKRVHFDFLIVILYRASIFDYNV